MKVINQIPGQTSLYEEISSNLKSGYFDEFYVLMSYMTWNGLSLFNEELERFYDSGGKLNFIVGLGKEGAEIDALRYLKDRMPDANFNAFSANNPAYVFHPKLYILKSKDRIVSIIGSNNLTEGGLFRNSELAVKIDEPKSAELLLDVWKSYFKPKKPFSKKNIRAVNNSFFSDYDKILVSQLTSPTKNKNRKTAVEIFTEKFGSINIPRRKAKSLPGININSSKKNKEGKKIKDSILLLEILNETGVAGVQVQLPTKVCRDYFYASGPKRKTIQLVINEVKKPTVISHFANNTHRITLSDLAGIKRPLLAYFEKLDNDIYDFKVFSDLEYKKYIQICNQQTRGTSRRWAILDNLKTTGYDK